MVLCQKISIQPFQFLIYELLLRVKTPSFSKKIAQIQWLALPSAQSSFLDCKVENVGLIETTGKDSYLILPRFAVTAALEQICKPHKTQSLSWYF